MKGAGWGFYFHVPFCLRKCIYCDFYSYRAKESRIRSYEQFLEKEVLLVKQAYMSNQETVESIYLGGGTPSLLKAEEYNRLFESIRRNFLVSEKIEITMEINPGRQASSIQEYLQTGINRLSIGVQSSVSRILQILQRPYSVQTLLNFLEEIQGAEVPIVSYDFLYGVPAQTLNNICSDLDMVEKMRPQHVSFYQFTRYTGTPYEKKVQKGELIPLSEEIILVQEKYIRERLQRAGYRQYEVSNYCLDNFVSQHNLKYWHLAPYYGFGEGGCSFFNNRFFENFRGEDYYRLVEKGALPIEQEKLYEPEEMLQNKLLMGLRLAEGIPWREVEGYIKRMEEKQAILYQEKINTLRKEGILQLKAGNLHSNPEFYSVLDSILLEFI